MAVKTEVQVVRTRVVEAIDRAAGELMTLSKYIHSNPEPALEEVKASAACASFLQERGFTVERGIADLPTSFRADVATGLGPTVAFLSEYDSLPGIGHGCGHNLIAIAGIGAGLGLSAAIGDVPGRVSVFGTPAEEAVGGKIIMAEVGAFNGIDAAFGAHPGTSEASCPTVEGSGNALACQTVRIAFHGEPAHAAADPYNGVNALNAIIEVFNGINALRQHVKSDARIHGIITNGGDVPNVVPHFAAAEFFVRAATLVHMNELVAKVERIAQGASLMTGATLEFTLPDRANFDMITNHTLARALKKNLDAVGLTMPEAKAEEGSGSTDWGNVSYHVPSVETSYPILDHVCTWHSQAVVEAADSELGYANTILVAKALALTGLDVLLDRQLLNDATREFETTLAGRQAAAS
jgi:amidohydrolase